MLYYEQVFGNVFERRENKHCGVSMKHRRKVKGEEVITLQMAQQLKNKNINVLPGQLFLCQYKAKYRLTILMIKIKFNLLQIMTMNSLNVKHQGKNWLQSTGISPISLHAFMKTLTRAIFQKYAKYKLTVWKIQSLIFMINMIWKRKYMTWLGCTRHHIQSKSLLRTNS